MLSRRRRRGFRVSGSREVGYVKRSTHLTHGALGAPLICPKVSFS